MSMFFSVGRIRLILAGMLIFVLAFVVLFVVRQIGKTSSPTLHVSSQSPTLSAEQAEQVSLDFLWLFPGVIWKVFDSNISAKPSLGVKGLYLQSDEIKTVNLEGYEWTSEIDNLDKESMENLIKEFEDYYVGQTTKFGWKTKMNIGSYLFTPLSADGPTGSVYGYIGASNESLRVLLLEIIREAKRLKSPIVCPCSVSFRVFVSDTLTLAEVIRQQVDLKGNQYLQ